MGALCSNGDSYQSRFRNKYEFIAQVNDHNFGEIKVYRKKQLNYDYVMVLFKYVQTSKLSRVAKEIEALHNAFLKQDEPMALRIFNFDIDDNQISNCSLSLVKIYVEYFNFTLHDLIQVHKQKGDSFTYDQLKYILNSCVLAYKQFLGITQKTINISSKCMYLTPDGAIKFSPIRYQQFYQHSTSVCNALCNQTEYKEIMSLERGQKYLTGQVKKIFNEIAVLNFQGDPEIDRIASLIQQIRKCHSIEGVCQKIGASKTQILNISNNKIQGSQQNTNQGKESSATQKGHSSTSNLTQKFITNESDSIKLSLTKNTKVLHKEKQQQRF